MIAPISPRKHRSPSLASSFRLIFTAVFVIVALPPDMVQSQPQSAGVTRIDQLSEQALRKEIELDRLVTSTHEKNDITTLEKRRRQFLWGIINSASTEAGLIDATALFFSHTRHVNKKVSEKTPEGIKTVEKGFPNRIHASAVAGSLYPQIIGQEINFGGDVFELTYNVIARAQLKKQQIDPKRALERAKKLTLELDAIMAERQKLAAATAEQTEVYEAEGAVLKDIEMELLAEFARQYVNARREFAWQNGIDLVDATRNAVGAAGNQISVHAVRIGNSGLNGTGSLLSMLAAIGIITRPYIAWTAQQTNAHLARHAVTRELPSSAAGTAAEKLKLDESHLQDLLRAQQEHPTAPRFATLSAEGTLLGAPQEDLDARETKAKSLRVFRDMARNTIVGQTKLANTIIGVSVGYRNDHDVTQNNRLAAAANLTYTIGQGGNFIELWRDRIVDELQQHRLYTERQTSRQILDARLKTLDQLSTQLVQR